MTGDRPPLWARTLAGLLVRGPRREFVLGDLEEMYVQAGRTGPGATLGYLAWVIGSAVLQLRAVTWGGMRMDVGMLRGFTRDLRVALRSLVTNLTFRF